MSELTILSDAIAYVMKNKSMFIRHSDANSIAFDLISGVMIDAMSTGFSPVTVDYCEEWWIVASDRDWVAGTENKKLSDVFSSLIANPKEGQNSSRHEILLTAFASSVYTSCDGDELLVKGKPPPKSIKEKFDLPRSKKRLIVFAM